MPGGKPAGVPCVNLDPVSLICAIWGTPAYPKTCRRFAPAMDVCGDSAEEAMRLIGELETQTL
jgi:hypothetical protein